MMYFNVLLFCTLSTVASLPYTPNPDGDEIPRDNDIVFDVERYIVGGRKASEGEIPHQAMLTLNGMFICGGVLISDRQVLSAAHCFEKTTSSDNFTVVLGTTSLQYRVDRKATPMDVKRRDVEVHPLYKSSTARNDLAIITLPAQVTPSERVRPVTMPDVMHRNPNFFRFLPGTISGWGMTSNRQKSASQYLMVGAVKVITQQTCRRSIWTSYSLDAGQVCTKAAPSDSCYGDSGGPLTVQYNGQNILVGIVSFSVDSRCASGVPLVYAYVPAYLTWINSITAKIL